MEQFKILTTNNYGSGWSTWESHEDVADFMLTYQPIIDYIDAKTIGGAKHDLHETHPLVLKMTEDIKEKFQVKYVCILGARNLEVRSVYRSSLVSQLGIRCHDGKESVGRCWPGEL